MMTAPRLASMGYQLDVDGYALLEHNTGVGRIDTLAVEASFGNPVPVVEAMSSMMRDGNLSRTTRDGNRIVTFRHRVTTPTPRMLDEAGEALVAAVRSARQLRWQKPGGASSDCYDVVRVQTERMFDGQWDVAERQKKRIYLVSYECLPYVRSGTAVTVEWTGGATELDPLSSMTGWTTVSGSAAYDANAGGIGVPGILAGGSGAVLRKTFTVDEYLWFKTPGIPVSAKGVTSVKVDGVTIPDAQVREEGNLVATSTRFYTVPVGAWRGQSVTVEFTLLASKALTELWTRSYPGPIVDAGDTRPKGLSVIDVIGTARTPCEISFTAPTGGAFVYTGPNPNAAIRDRGVDEQVYGRFTVDPGGAEISFGGRMIWLPEGDHRLNIGTTNPQPPELFPDGVWPTQPSGQALTGTGIAAGAAQWSYPVDMDAEISVFDTAGSKTLIPAGLTSDGYFGDAIDHETHTLYPGRSGFAVEDLNGDPIPTTITYYPRGMHNAPQ